MAGRYHRIWQGITLEAEPSSNGQKELEEFGEDGVRHTPKGAAHRGRSTEDYIRDLEEIAGRVWLRWRRTHA